MDKNELFKKLYNELEILLNSKYKNTNNNYSVVKRFENDSKEPYRSKIKLIREIRNLLVHQDALSLFPSLEVSDESIDFLRKQIDFIKNPLTAEKVCIKKENVMFASLDTNLLELIQRMNKTHYSHVPILDKKERVIGVFSENSIFSYVGAENGVINIDSNTTLEMVKNYVLIHEHRSEEFLFVSKNLEINELEKLFQKLDSNSKKVVMLFVTHHGKENEKLIGIITPFDLVGK